MTLPNREPNDTILEIGKLFWDKSLGGHWLLTIVLSRARAELHYEINPLPYK